MIEIGEAAAGPAHDRHVQRLQGVEDIIANAIGVGDVTVGAYPDPAIGLGADMFEELAVDFRRDCVGRGVEIHIKCGLGGG
jgi:hypothetical protein